MSMFGLQLAAALRKQQERQMSLDALASERPITLVGRLTSLAAETISFQHRGLQEQRTVYGLADLLGSQTADGCRLRVVCCARVDAKGSYLSAQEATVILF